MGPVLAVACVLLFPSALRAQATWLGTGGSQFYLTPANWSGGVVPPNTGADSALFTTTGTQDFIYVNTAANLSGINLQSNAGYIDYFFDTSSGGTLTLGSGGIAMSGTGYSAAYLYIPITLSVNQTWGSTSGGFIESYGYGISGPGSLTINGYVYLDGNDTFSGGITVANGGSLELGSATSSGSGAITLNSGSTLTGYGYTFGNSITLGPSVTLSSYNEYPGMTLTGPITLQNAATTVTIGYDSSVSVMGLVSGPPSTALTISGANAPGYGSKLPYDGGSQLVFGGSLSNISSIDVYNAGLILEPSGSIASLATTGLQVTGQGYLGFDTPFTTPGAVSAFLGLYGTSLGTSINGSLGFDTVAGGTANVFSDPINLSGFNSSGFLGLGSESGATLSGTITPYNNLYLFGGGGGTLTLTSSLIDNGVTPRALMMPVAPEPLTLMVQGTATYTGGTTVNGGVLVFNANVPLTGAIATGTTGYVGYTENAANITTAQQFVNLFGATAAYGVIGFDSTSSRTLTGSSGTINLSGFTDESSPFVGTATDVTLAATITPANGTYQVTGVKGGQLTITSALTGTNAVVIGLATPVETNGSTSTVNITPATAGLNTYSGGTTFNSGNLWVNSDNALGSGTISVPDTDPYMVTPFLAPFGSPTVTLANPISVGSISGNPGLTVGDGNYGGDMLVLSGSISNGTGSGILGIDGPVTLTGTSSYSGGTVFDGIGYASALVSNGSALGSGPITVESSAVLAPTGGPVTLSNPIQLESTLTLGQGGNSNLLTLSGAISGYYGLTIEGPVDLTGANTFSGNVLIENANVAIGNPGALGTGVVTLSSANITESYTNPTFTDLTGDSGSSIGLVPSATLTLNTDTNSEYFDYSGSITGDSTDQVVVQGTGIQYLGGNSTYSGGTTVVSGKLIAGSNSALGTGTVTVDSGAGLGVANPTVLTNAITLMPGAGVGGDGTFSPSGGLSISGTGTKISPGSDGVFAPYVANLSFGSALTFGSGGKYVFDVQNANGAAGSGYDTLTNVGAPGTLAITATPGSPFTIAVESVTPGGYGTLGPAANFNSTMSYTWTLVSASSIAGFSAADFSINLSGFQNSIGTGIFTVGESGNLLTLNFTPVPEPSTWMLMAGGLAAVLLVGIRRTRRA